ncbi:alpha/beta fold hydrolase [Streptomyces hundungensis]|uniref:alpha/beta fold hydrolase n=1 Tax=Streptomyces hundungensis TaxID=1077946 RepID=UPI0033C3A4AE
MRPVEVLRSGEGPPVVLVHGDVLSARTAWAAQERLAGRYSLRLVNRRGYGGSPSVAGQDFLVDAQDVAEALEEGAHLVGHSFGAVAALIAAGHHPGRVRSLTVVEPLVLALVRKRPDARAFVRRYAEIAARCHSPESFLEEYLVLVGTASNSVAPALPATLPPRMRRAVVTQMRGKCPWEAELPLAALGHAPFPRLVVSGGHHDLFQSAGSALARAIGAEHLVLSGAGHVVQALGAPFNDALTRLWQSRPEPAHA